MADDSAVATFRATTLSDALRRYRRALVVVACALGAASVSIGFWSLHPDGHSDFFQVWAGARALLAGQNPYSMVGPGRTFDYQWVTPYPLPAFLLAMPFAWLPMRLVDPVVTALGAGALAWVLTRERWNDPRLLVFASYAYLGAAQFSQWSPILTAAVFVPTLGVVLAAKPSIAVALWVAYPSWQSAASALVIVIASFAVMPGWVAAWLPTLDGLTHLRAPITFAGGPLILAALWRWRLPEARLLVALGCVPQSTFLYETIPLFLIPRRIKSAAFLVAMSLVVGVIFWNLSPYPTYKDMVATMGQWMVWLIYLPCLVMVLRRRDG